MDRQIVWQKLESLRKCLGRISDKCPETADLLALDLDAQDIITLNLTRAVQLCVDVAAHLIAGRNIAAPGTMGETFDALAQAAIINDELAIRLKRTVGFRNIAVHNYEAIDWQIVYAICQQHLIDFKEYAKAVTDAL